ncbi:MAG: hypothetical protein H0X15_11020 [Acidobacteria bacterium]|nr:hypothetical protein [Acidobacteriota bacterium]MBA3786043.1 hypothetical protein [Acidobacteriota bacterium]MBA4185559.1 hypothetical protein [Acidobacteriota bacterium]
MHRSANLSLVLIAAAHFLIYVMDFDHRVGEEKKAHVSRLVGMMNLQNLLDEIEKCDVVCANCHRIRTYERNQRFSGMV